MAGESMSTRTIRNLFAPGVALTLLLAAGALHAASKKDPPKPTADECLTCHCDATLSHEINGKTVSLHVDPQAFKDSIHGSMFTCVDCHTDVKSSAHDTPPQHITCATCHADEQAAYERSFHAKAVQDGNANAATCVDCHGSHEILDAKDSKSPIFKFNVPVTCGKCHEQISKEFQQSIPGQAIAKANWQAPVCTDCHGIHTIKAHTDPNSPVSAQNVAQATCARCHEGMRLSHHHLGLPGAPDAPNRVVGLRPAPVSRMVLLCSGADSASRAPSRLE
jgi:hypothetical protein